MNDEEYRTWLVRGLVEAEIDRLKNKIVAIDARYGSHHSAWDGMIAHLEHILAELGGSTWVVLKPKANT